MHPGQAGIELRAEEVPRFAWLAGSCSSSSVLHPCVEVGYGIAALLIAPPPGRIR